jgi:hypothetical protein
MDEPLRALDAQMRLVIQDELLTLWEKTQPLVLLFPDTYPPLTSMRAVVTGGETIHAPPYIELMILDDDKQPLM